MAAPASRANLDDSRPVLFIDRCAWSRKLGQALTAASIPYVVHQDHFSHDTADEVWLTAVRDNGWLILTRDQRIRYKVNEHRALVNSRLLMFVLTQGGLTAQETGTIVVKAYPQIVRLAAQTEPPALFSVTRAGEARPLKLSS